MRAMRYLRCLGLPALAMGVHLLGASAAPAADITVLLDQAKLEKLPSGVGTLIIGNPLIADVALQTGGLMVITGKGYGVTNLLVLDKSGTVIAEKSIEVRAPRNGVVVVYRGAERESYSCTSTCERRVTLGDSGSYFESTMAQSDARNNSATGAAAK